MCAVEQCTVKLGEEAVQSSGYHPRTNRLGRLRATWGRLSARPARLQKLVCASLQALQLLLRQHMN